MPTYITTQARTINNRALKAGDEFIASRRDGALLVKLGRAELKPESFRIPPPPKAPKPAEPAAPAAVTEPAEPAAPAAVTTPESEASGEPPPASVVPDNVIVPSVDTLTTARDDYERIVGKRWFHGWDETELRRRIAEFEAGNGGS